MDISDCIAADGVLVGLNASNKQDLLRMLAEEAGRQTGIPGETILAALQKREALGSTGIGGGIALPHAPVDGIEKSFGMFARLTRPIDFEAIDDDPVDIVCVVLTPLGGGKEHLTLLSRIARQLRQVDIVAKMRRAKSAAEIHAVLTEGREAEGGAS